MLLNIKELCGDKTQMLEDKRNGIRKLVFTNEHACPHDHSVTLALRTTRSFLLFLLSRSCVSFSLCLHSSNKAMLTMLIDIELGHLAWSCTIRSSHILLLD